MQSNINRNEVIEMPDFNKLEDMFKENSQNGTRK